MKWKKIALGTISTLAATAPIVVAVSCGSYHPWSKREHREYTIDVNLSNMENESIGSQFQMLPLEQQSEEFKQNFTKQSSNNERIMNDFTKDTLRQAIQDANPACKTMMVKVTFSDKVKKIIQEAEKRAFGTIKELIKMNFLGYSFDNVGLDIKGTGTNLGFESNFFEKIINLENTKDKMSLLSQAINDLEKEAGTDYRVVFQLVLPKWLEKLSHLTIKQFSSNDLKEKTPKQYTTDQIQSVVNAKDANVKLTSLIIESGIKYFDIQNLPQGLKSFNLSNNNLTSFDATKLPQGLKMLDLSNNNLTSFDATKLPQGLKTLYLSYNKLTSFDATELPQGLEGLNLDQNALKSFDTTHLPQGLERLNLSDNKLTSFDATKLPQGLEELNLDQNALKSFDATKLPQGLKMLDLSYNKLTSFDATKLPQGLERLNLSDNKLPQSEKDKIIKWWKDHHGKDTGDPNVSLRV